MTPALRLAALALVMALPACGPLVQIGGNATPPESLLTLTATTPPAAYAGPVAASSSLAVETPAVPLILQTLRVPVTTSPIEVRYLAGASWAEQPNRQFQRLLTDTLTAKGVAIVDARQTRTPPARTLSGTLASFGLDVSDPARPVVRIRYDAQLGSIRTASTVMLRRFDAEEPVSDQTPVAVADALNRAANRVAVAVSAWVTG